MDGEIESLARIDRYLEYVRRAQPRAVVVEMVDTAYVVAGITDLVGQITGYRWRAATIDPSVFEVPAICKTTKTTCEFP